ncbi:serine hydrolase domain-containing protein [Novosphingobium piscinae]|uniref:Beta-lactamase family protein n=1 Tax=Novosphingobium piscinae TaxID=1507448 RepID=A0A7X1FV78_9SPHN|nr:serine hydrolase domain-containing protein [Novosphingobium piscinae]MBC2667585.1 beta-lactamase family protein [Novosphingobium piscinae]
MIVRTALFGLAVLLLAGRAPAETPAAASLAEVDRIFADWRLSAHVPGLVYGVVAEGRLVHVRALGVQDTVSQTPVTADSLFRIASMSKAFTALAILKLRDDGKLSLDTPAERYIPQMKGWRYPTSDSPKITVRHLLTHTAGFVEDNPWGDRQQVMAETDFTRLITAGPAFARPPGLAMEYSNLGYALLGRIITNVSGKPYQDYIRGELMQPLGLRDTGYDIFASPPARRALGYRWQDSQWVREPDMQDGAFGAMGGVETSATDYARWVAFLLSAWPARDGPETGPVRRATVREIATGSNFAAGTLRPVAAGGASCRRAVAYAMGWSAIDDCDLGMMLSHAGGYPGYGSIALLLPQRGVGIFAFASRTYAGPGLPATRALLALQRAGQIDAARPAGDTGLAQAYAAAKAVWHRADITAAPLANNMLLDRDAARWRRLVETLKAEVGTCAADEPLQPLSLMEGRFTWNCEHGRIAGRVQRSPNPTVEIQALEFGPADP